MVSLFSPILDSTAPQCAKLRQGALTTYHTAALHAEIEPRCPQMSPGVKTYMGCPQLILLFLSLSISSFSTLPQIAHTTNYDGSGKPKITRNTTRKTTKNSETIKFTTEHRQYLDPLTNLYFFIDSLTHFPQNSHRQSTIACLTTAKSEKITEKRRQRIEKIPMPTFCNSLKTIRWWRYSHRLYPLDVPQFVAVTAKIIRRNSKGKAIRISSSSQNPTAETGCNSARMAKHDKPCITKSEMKRKSNYNRQTTYIGHNETETNPFRMNTTAHKSVT
jgi:hypothetical protein